MKKFVATLIAVIMMTMCVSAMAESCYNPWGIATPNKTWDFKESECIFTLAGSVLSYKIDRAIIKENDNYFYNYDGVTIAFTSEKLFNYENGYVTIIYLIPDILLPNFFAWYSLKTNKIITTDNGIFAEDSNSWAFYVNINI